MQQTASTAPANAGRGNSGKFFILTTRNSQNPTQQSSVNYEFWLSDSKRPALLAGNEKIVSIRRVPRVFASL